MKRTAWCVLALATVDVAVAGAQANGNQAGSDRARATVTRVSSAKANAGAAMVAAAARGDGAAARALLAQGADVSAATGDGMTALHWAAHYGDAALATALLKAGARTDAKSRVGGYTPLHVASRTGAGSVVKALVAAGANVNTPTETGAYAMHLAAASGSAEAVTALVGAKADPNALETQWGQTPLMFAATANRPETITALLKAGAKPSLHTQPLDLSEELARQQAAARKRNEVLLAALPKQQRDSIMDAMEKAATAQARQRAEFLGTAAPAAPAAPATGAAGTAAAPPRRVGTAAPPITSLTPTQVQEAIRAGRQVFDQPEAVKAPAEQGELLEGNIAGYEGTVGKLGGLTALLHASRQGNIAAAKALLDGGADINEVSSTDSTSPLLMATINGQFDLAMELLNRGANVKLASTAGLTSLYAAINTFWAPRSRYPQPQAVQTQKTSHLDLMRVMIKNGADVNVRLRKNLWFFAYSNCGNANCGLEQLEGTTPFWRATYAVDIEAMKMLKAAGADDTMPSFRSPQAGGRGGRGGGGGGAPAPGAMVGVDAQTDSAAKAAVPGIGVYPIHAAAGVGYGNGFAGNSHRHAPDGWMPALKYLVEELGHDVNKRDLTGYTPLHHAAARGDNDMILYLVSKGADVKAVARNGRTTVDIANGPVQRLRPFPETIALLEKLGAKNSHRCVSC